MNPEQNAKAYEMALEAARKELGVDRKEWEVVQQVLCNIFPELAKSDNERIRHWLIGLISADYKDDNFPSGIKKTDVLNWLKKESVVYEQGMYYYDGKKFLYCQQEKPKVAIPTLDSVKQNKSDDERILASIADCVGLMGEDGDVFSNHNVTKVQVFSWLEKQNAQKSSIEEILTKAGLKPYKDGNQWCILAGDNIQEGICGFGDTINEALYQFLMEVLEKQKVLIAIPDELVKNYKHFCEIGCREAAMLINAINGISEQKEQKPLTTEETELNSIAFLEQMGYTCIPPRKEQKPAEWSKEDEEMLTELLLTIEPSDNYDEMRNWLLLKLKSLLLQGSKDSLQTHWKPSEDDKQYFDNLVVMFEKSLRDNRCYFTSYDVDWLKSKLNGNTCE